MQDQSGTGDQIDLDALLRGAVAEAGLDDFGKPDVRLPLSVLVDALNKEAGLTPAGMAGQRATLHRTLVNRLRLTEAFKRHPEIAEQPIRGPIVIVGMPRSGTTKLQRMLACDPGLQKLPLWRIMNPAPFPDARPGEPDPRIAYAEEVVRRAQQASPAFYAAHPMAAEEPDEEIFLMLLTFICSIPMHSTDTPSYRKWMAAQDCTDWYRSLRRLLQYFQWQDGASGKPWLLKAPWHFRWLRTLFEIFPDTTIVHAYRDPLQTVASMAAMYEESRKVSSDRVRPDDIAEIVMGYWADASRRFVRERTEMRAEERFVDVLYTDIVADPESVIRRIYATAGLPLTDAALAAMHAWADANPQNKHGTHRYALEHFGLSDRDIDSGFGLYRARFRPGGA